MPNKATTQWSTVRGSFADGLSWMASSPGAKSSASADRVLTAGLMRR
ncbi:MAG: hypothetical protein AB1768_07355 [Pseudomonadota bacterium]